MAFVEDLKNNLNDRMIKTIQKLGEELSAIRTGRANAGMLDTIKVEVYGSMMPINQIANIGVPEARVMEIKPWDISTLGDIEKAILKSQLGLTPNNDGKLIRLVLPLMTEESRKNLVKFAKKIEEQFKIMIRNERRDANENLKKAEKNKEITEDLMFGLEKEVQEITDKYIKKIDEMIHNKEQEIMEV